VQLYEEQGDQGGRSAAVDGGGGLERKRRRLRPRRRPATLPSDSIRGAVRQVRRGQVAGGRAARRPIG